MSATSNAASIVAHPAVRASDGDPRSPETISPWEMVLLNEDKIPLGAIVLVPSKWVTH